MPGFLLHTGATVMCLHGGQAQPMATDSRVSVSGQLMVVQIDGYTITGCTIEPPGQCVTAQWVTAATRLKASGIPVLLQDSQAVCVAPGTGLNVVFVQARVKGM